MIDSIGGGLGKMTDINWMDLNEFVDEGFLQEVNRQFFHPLGLALAVSYSDGKAVGLAGLWDYRDDPDGIYYADGHLPEADKAKGVEALRTKKAKKRHELLGWIIQPLELDYDLS